MKNIIKTFVCVFTLLVGINNVEAWNYTIDDIMSNLSKSDTYNYYHDNSETGTKLDYIYSGSKISVNYSLDYNGDYTEYNSEWSVSDNKIVMAFDYDGLSDEEIGIALFSQYILMIPFLESYILLHGLEDSSLDDVDSDNSIYGISVSISETEGGEEIWNYITLDLNYDMTDYTNSGVSADKDNVVIPEADDSSDKDDLVNPETGIYFPIMLLSVILGGSLFFIKKLNSCKKIYR